MEGHDTKMAKFKITLNMPSKRGGQVHQVLCIHGAETLEAFMAQWRDEGFIVVTELYNQDDGSLKPNCEIALTDAIGAKVSYLTEREWQV